MNSKFKENIIIGSHNIDCTGAIKEARYKETKSGKFDGIHLFGSSGQKAYTQSVLAVLKFAQLTSGDYDYHHSCPQYRYQGVQYMQQKTQYRQQESQYRQQGAFSYTGDGKQSRNDENQRKGFTVPTQNRFENFSKLNQGNW